MGFPSQDRAPSSPPLSLFSSFIFLLFLKTMICFSGCLMSSASIQKLFCGIYSALKCSFEEFLREKVVSPSYSSTILGPPPSISPFKVCCKAGLVVLNSLNFYLSEKLFISSSILNEILSGYSNLGCRFFPFSTLNISCHFLLAGRVSAERSAVKCTGFPLYVTCCFLPCCF